MGLLAFFRPEKSAGILDFCCFSKSSVWKLPTLVKVNHLFKIFICEVLLSFIYLMTCTSIVWKHFQNWIQITKNFRNHFQIPKDFQNSFLIQNGIRKNTKWFQVVDRLLGSPRPWLKGYLFQKMTLLDMLNDTKGFWL